MSSIHSRLSRGMTSLDSRWHTVMTVCLVAVLSYVATKLGIAMIVSPHHISPFWPTNALLLAVLLLVPRRVWPVLLVTTYVIVALLDLQSGNSIVSVSGLRSATWWKFSLRPLWLAICSEVHPSLTARRLWFSIGLP